LLEGETSKRFDKLELDIEEGENEDEEDRLLDEEDIIGPAKTAAGVGATDAGAKTGAKIVATKGTKGKAPAPKGKAVAKKTSTKRKKDDDDDDDGGDDDDDDTKSGDSSSASSEGEDYSEGQKEHAKNSIEKIDDVEEVDEGGDDNVDDDLLASYQNEKDLIEGCLKKKPSNLTSAIWSKVLFIDTTSVLECCDEETVKKNNFEGIKRIQQQVRDKKPSLPVICSICFDTPNIGLRGGVVLVHIKTGKSKDAHPAPQTSNFVTHLKIRAREDEEHAKFLDMIMASRLRSDTSVGTVKSAASAVSLVHPVYTEWAKLPKAQVLTRMHQLLYLLVNDANIPAHIVRNPRLWDLIEFIAANGKTLEGSTRNALMMGRHKFNTIQAVSFAEMVSVVERLVEENRRYFKKLTGRTVPFMYVGHDLWDGKNKNVLGLCIFMVSHLLKRMIAFPVGILRSRNKKAVKVAEQSLKALKR
jgi:hypothetical protein